MLCGGLILCLLTRSIDEPMPIDINQVCSIKSTVVAGAPALSRSTERDLTLVLDMRLSSDWHTYWWDAGSWGAPPRLSVAAPAGWEIGSAVLPVPERIETELGPVYGYHDSVRLQVPLRRPDCSAADLTYELEWLVCKEACLLGMETKTIKVPSVLPSGDQKSLQQDAEHLAPGRRLRSRLVGNVLRIEHPKGCLGRPVVVFRPIDAVSRLGDEPDMQDEEWALPLQIRREDFPEGEPVTLHGLLLFQDGASGGTYAFSTSLNN
ncbi:MAG: hypothetical protein CMJ28_02430 [Phycisphaerae bacterium]|nr:hypothetical protein [Phycisphaerae bacterium]